MKLISLAALGCASAVRLASDPIFSSAGKEPFPEPEGHQGEYFNAPYDKFPGTDNFAPKYDRKMPDHF